MKVLIIGGVAGGAGTAARLRRNDEGAEIILFEKDDYISFANCGLPYYVGGQIADKEELLLQTPESFHALFRVDVRVRNEVLSVNTQEQTVEVKDHITGTTYTESYDKLVLSPGAHPLRPPIPGSDQEQVFTLRNIPDICGIADYIEEHQPKTAVVVGAGFIGLEMAENLAERGIETKVVDASPHVIPPLDMDMAHFVHNYIREKQLGLYLNATCKQIGTDHVVLSDERTVPADMVILSIGVAPSTGFLKGSEIALGERGEILVNEKMETSVPNVYALGDGATVTNLVTGERQIIPLAGPANKQARLVADNLVGKEVSYKGSIGTAIMKFFDMTVATTGANEAQLQKWNIPYVKAITHSASHASYYPGGELMIVKTLAHKETHQILGGQIVGGKGVDKRIDNLANAIRFQGTHQMLEDMELAYAPPYSSAKDPVNMAGFVLGNIFSGMGKVYYLEDLEAVPDDAEKLDVRTPEEYAEGHIPGYRNLPLQELRDRLEEVDLSKPIYLYCLSGPRGYFAQRIIDYHGATSYNLMGGYAHYLAREQDLAAQSN